MSATGYIKVNGQITGLPTGSKVFEGSRVVANANGTILTLKLNNGNNTVQVPVNPPTNGMLIKLPDTNTFECTLSLLPSPNGFPIGTKFGTFVSWTPGLGPAQFTINSAGNQVDTTEISFF